ncbi:MAG: choice-of-anchor tandem repeat GloVer-containing protein [Bryobacteraceae bacterium]
MKHLRQQKAIRIVATLALTLALAGIAIPAQAQTFTSLYSFAGYPTDGSYPTGLVQGANGYLYGTTVSGGLPPWDLSGIVFKISTTGTETILDNLYNEDLITGSSAGLALATNGDFYGVSNSSMGGTVYKVTPGGAFTNLYTICPAGGPDCPNGFNPEATMMQASNGDLYGTTQLGGAGVYGGQGTIFKITLAGAQTTLHSFCETLNPEGDCVDGEPPITALVQGTNGDLYGATHNGGAYGGGTIFKITMAGDFTTLYNFCSLAGCADGVQPYAALVQGADGNFYGVTGSGGMASGGGTFFTMTPGGALTTLYSFCSLADCADGAYPLALMLATDANFYGMTGSGGTDNMGTIFQITPSGSLTTEHRFDGTDGSVGEDQPGPYLIQDTSGTFYGVTALGGANYQTCATCNGTVFSLSMGLGPFVKTLPTSGRVGSNVKILGNRLTGATSVTFNGVAATFTVASSTEITTTVPTGATTGVVQVVTSRGTTLTSNLVFTIP